jgi:hypothetical protein
MLVCEGCALGWPLYCLEPPLSEVPEGIWVCPVCISSGVTVETIEARQRRGEGIEGLQQEHAAQRRKMFPNATQRRRNQRYAELHGRLIYKQRPVSGSPSPVVGRLAFEGVHFNVRYTDGSTEQLSNQAVAKRRHWLLPVATDVPGVLRLPEYEAVPWEVSAVAGAAELSVASGESQLGMLAEPLPELLLQPGSAAFEQQLQADLVVLLRQLDLGSMRQLREAAYAGLTAQRVFQLYGFELSPAEGRLSVTAPADFVLCSLVEPSTLDINLRVLPLLALHMCAIRVPVSWLSDSRFPWSELSRSCKVTLLSAAPSTAQCWVWLVC